MKKFLENLRTELKKKHINEGEIEEILRDHEEMIDEALAEGLSEEDITKKFGNPEQVAADISAMNKGVESIFAPYSADFIILASMTHFYYPIQNVNTICNWDYQTGYKIKAENEFDVTLTGLKPGSQILELTQGWNLLPMLSPANVDVVALFSSVNLVIAKEVAGNKLYWPQFGINTLGYLAPGKAYFVLLSSPGEVDYSGFKTSQVKLENLSASPDLTAGVLKMTIILDLLTFHKNI